MKFQYPKSTVALVGWIPHVKNASWATAERFAGPIVFLVITPWLLKELGAINYGLFAFANTIAALGGIGGLGVPIINSKIVAEQFARGNPAGAIETVRSALALVLLGTGVLAAIAAVCSPFLLPMAFGKLGAPNIVFRVTMAALPLLVIQHLDAIYASTLRGMEQFASACRIEIAAKICFALAACGVAWKWKDPAAVILVRALAVFLGAWFKAAAASRSLGGAIFLPKCTRISMKIIFAESRWMWFQSLAGMTFSTLDRLLVGSLFGATALGAYTICVQATQFVHALPAAALQPILPRMSAQGSSGRFVAVRRAARYAIFLNFLLSIGLGGLLVLSASFLLRVWINGDFANQYWMLFVMLVAASSILSINVAPYFILVARGRAKTIAMIDLWGGVAMLVSIFLLQSTIGVMAAAVGRIVYGLIVCVNLIQVMRLS